MKSQRPPTPVFGSELLVIARGAGIAFGGTIIGSALRYVFQVIAARSIGPELLGVFFLSFAVFKLAGVLAELGLSSGVVRYVALYHGEGDRGRVKGIILLSIRWAAAAGIAVFLLLNIVSKPLAANIFHNPDLEGALRLLSLGIPFAAATSMMVFGTQGFKIMRYKALVREIFEPGFRLMIVVLLLVWGMGLHGVIISCLIPLAVSPILAFACLRKVFPPISDRGLKPIYEARKLLDFSWPLLFVQFLGFALLWTDTLMLGYFRTVQEVGVYGAAQKTALFGSVIITSFNSILAPVVSDLYNRQEYAGLEQYFQVVTKWIFTFSLPVYLLIVFFRVPVLNIFGPEFAGAAAALFILSAGWIIYSAVASAGQIIVMTGRQKLHFINMAGLMILNIALNAILIPRHGMAGAAVATSLSITAFGLLELSQVRRYLRIQPFRADFLKPLAAGTVSALVLFVMAKMFFKVFSFQSPIPGALLFCCLYGAMICAFGLQPEDRIVLGQIKEKILSAIQG